MELEEAEEKNVMRRRRGYGGGRERIIREGGEGEKQDEKEKKEKGKKKFPEEMSLCLRRLNKQSTCAKFFRTI